MKKNTVLKAIVLVMALICAVSAFASCGSEEAAKLKISVSELYAKIEPLSSCEDGMINYLPNLPDSLLDATGIDASLYSEGIYAVSGDFNSAETVAFFVASTEENAKTIASKLETKRISLVTSNKDYNADNYAIANNGTVVTKGVYVFLVISSEKDKIVQVIEENL